jgi:hypothetical protein
LKNLAGCLNEVLWFYCVAPSHPQQIPFSSLQQVERLICPSSQGDLPAINAPQVEPQWIHLFQQKAAAAKIEKNVA